MKRLTSLLAAGALTLSMAACHTANTDKNTAVTETVATDNALVVAQQATIDSMKAEIVKQRVVDSMLDIAQEKAFPKTVVAATSRRKTSRKARTTQKPDVYSSGATYSNAAYSTPAPVYTPEPVYEPAPPAKKGWSAKAKGAVIGAGAGAVGGAIINKRNRVAGAVIGGLGGAAVGTGIGAILDRKNGR